MEAHWSDDYYGDLYYDSVADLLTSRLSSLEASAIRGLLAIGARARVLDLACGHARHARALSLEVGLLVGLDRSRDYLARAIASGALLVRGDLRALPFSNGTFDASFSWYSSLFMYGDRENEHVLAEAARVLRPGGRLLVQHANPARLAHEPRARAERLLAAGDRVQEVSCFDPATGVDACERRLTRVNGTVLAGTAYLRYYSPKEWEALARVAGLRLLRITSTCQSERNEPIDDDAPDLIALTEKLS